MKWISRLFWFLLLAAMFLLALLTVNQQKVELTFLDWQTPELSVFWWLLIAFGVGLSLGLIAAMINSTKHSLRHRRANKELKARDKELDALRKALDDAAPAPEAAEPAQPTA